MPTFSSQFYIDFFINVERQNQCHQIIFRMFVVTYFVTMVPFRNKKFDRKVIKKLKSYMGTNYYLGDYRFNLHLSLA